MVVDSDVMVGLDLSFVVLGFDRGKTGLLVNYDGGCGRSEFRERGG